MASRRERGNTPGTALDGVLPANGLTPCVPGMACPGEEGLCEEGVSDCARARDVKSRAPTNRTTQPHALSKRRLKRVSLTRNSKTAIGGTKILMRPKLPDNQKSKKLGGLWKHNLRIKMRAPEILVQPVSACGLTGTALSGAPRSHQGRSAHNWFLFKIRLRVIV